MAQDQQTGRAVALPRRRVPLEGHQTGRAVAPLRQLVQPMLLTGQEIALLHPTVSPLQCPIGNHHPQGLDLLEEEEEVAHLVAAAAGEVEAGEDVNLFPSQI